MPRVDVHGTTVTWSTTGLRGDPLEALLGVFPAAPAPPSGPEGITITASGVHEPLPGAIPGARQSFFLGDVRAYSEDNGGLRLRDGRSEVLISADGAHLEVLAHEGDEPHPIFVQGTLFTALVVALRHRGLFHLHGGAVVGPDGEVVLSVGPGGAGKSTLTLAFAEAGFRYLGDDAVFFRESTSGGVELLALPRPFHVGPLALRAFPRLEAHAGAVYRPDSDKRLLEGEKAFPGRFLWSATAPNLLLIPEVMDGPTTTAIPMVQADALGQTLEASAWVLVDELARQREQMALLGRLVSGARCHRVRLGRDLLTSPAEVVSKLRTLWP